MKKNILRLLKHTRSIQDLLHYYFLSLDLLCLSLTKTLLYPTKDSCSPHRDLHCKGEEAKKKEHGGQKEGRSAGDSCQSFRRFSRRILSATPGARIRIRIESQRDRGPADFVYAGALGNGKLLQWV